MLGCSANSYKFEFILQLYILSYSIKIKLWNNVLLSNANKSQSGYYYIHESMKVFIVC